MPAAIVDTGPLVAFLDRSERFQHWVAKLIDELDGPLLLCEPVLTEAMHLLARFPKAQEALFGFLENGALSLAFRLADHVSEVRALLRKYRNVPMSVADACLVRMAEIHDRHCVLTFDSDFAIYRKNGKAPLLVLSPVS